MNNQIKETHESFPNQLIIKRLFYFLKENNHNKQESFGVHKNIVSSRLQDMFDKCHLSLSLSTYIFQKATVFDLSSNNRACTW